MSTPSATPTVGNKIGLVHSVQCWHCSFLRAAASLQSPFLLLVRLYWGWQLAQNGWGKLHNLGHLRDFFSSLGIPAPGATAPCIASLEFFGGILLIIGLATRITSLLLAVDMFAAYVTADREALSSVLSNPGKFYVADPFTFLFAALICLVFGAGFFSLDYVLAHRRKG
jgi:putative oxidoreductase